jgi:hypothetical protein
MNADLVDSMRTFLEARQELEEAADRLASVLVEHSDEERQIYRHVTKVARGAGGYQDVYEFFETCGGLEPHEAKALDSWMQTMRRATTYAESGLRRDWEDRREQEEREHG